MVGAVTKADRDAVKRVLKEFWKETPDGWINDRAQIEIGKAEHQSSINREIAKEREAKRRAARNTNDQPNEPSTNRSTNGQPNHSQTPDCKPSPCQPSSTTDGSQREPPLPLGDDPPTQPGQWLAHFNSEHGTQFDPASAFDRRNIWPIFTRWCAAGVTVGQISQAVKQAHSTAKEPISNLVAYTDRVLASMQQGATNDRTAKRTAALDELTGRNREAGGVVEGTATRVG